MCTPLSSFALPFLMRASNHPPQTAVWCCNLSTRIVLTISQVLILEWSKGDGVAELGPELYQCTGCSQICGTPLAIPTMPGPRNDNFAALPIIPRNGFEIIAKRPRCSMLLA